MLPTSTLVNADCPSRREAVATRSAGTSGWLWGRPPPPRLNEWMKIRSVSLFVKVPNYSKKWALVIRNIIVIFLGLLGILVFGKVVGLVTYGNIRPISLCEAGFQVLHYLSLLYPTSAAEVNSIGNYCKEMEKLSPEESQLLRADRAVVAVEPLIVTLLGPGKFVMITRFQYYSTKWQCSSFHHPGEARTSFCHDDLPHPIRHQQGMRNVQDPLKTEILVKENVVNKYRGYEICMLEKAYFISFPYSMFHIFH